MNQTHDSIRSLTIKQNSVEFTLSVPASIWGFADQLKEEFAMENTDITTEIELAASFLKAASDRAKQDSSYNQIAELVAGSFNSQYLKGNNIHAVVRGLPLESQKSVIKSFYSSLQFNTGFSQSALFTAAKSGDAKLFAIFGGQGNIEEYFDELEDIWNTYQDIVQPFINRMAAVLTECARKSEIKTLHPEGFEILRWLKDVDVRPENQYLISAPVSLPLIGLTQLLHYYVMIRSLGCSPADIRDLLKGMRLTIILTDN